MQLITLEKNVITQHSTAVLVNDEYKSFNADKDCRHFILLFSFFLCPATKSGVLQEQGHLSTCLPVLKGREILSH